MHSLASLYLEEVPDEFPFHIITLEWAKLARVYPVGLEWLLFGNTF